MPNTHHKKWYWELTQKGVGPDYIFTAQFHIDDGVSLAQLVKRYLPAEYVVNTAKPPSPHAKKCGTYASFLDQHTHDRLLQQQATGTTENIYYSGEIDVCGAQFTIFHTLASGLYDETDMILALADDPALTLIFWSIDYSGDQRVFIKKGRSRNTLLAYLSAV